MLWEYNQKVNNKENKNKNNKLLAETIIWMSTIMAYDFEQTNKYYHLKSRS